MIRERCGNGAGRGRNIGTLRVLFVPVFLALAGCGGSGGEGTQPDDTGLAADLDVQTPEQGVGTDTVPVLDKGLSAESGPDIWLDVAGEAAMNETMAEACIPNCSEVECGEDGCGDVCGYCLYGFLCKAGVCIEFCVPDCEGKACGDDGCGGWCADCEENETCAPDFTCVLKSCEPKCDLNLCGPDGCGGSCGSCGEGFVCLGGQCVVDTNCYDITAEGICQGDQLLWCENSVLMKETCDTESGFVCGYSHLAKKYACTTPEQCEPQCTGKECGPDLCGGECGQCGGIETCSTGGVCGPPCGDVTGEGVCQGKTLSFCHQGILIIYDCGSAGKDCKWDPTGNSGQGWYDCL